MNTQLLCNMVKAMAAIFTLGSFRVETIKVVTAIMTTNYI